MSTNPSPMSDEDREELIAYLDGELDEEKAHAVESKMSLDPATRAEADTLKKTWDLLDYLPRPEPSPNFTNRTLDRISTRETQNALRPARRLRRWLTGLGWAAAVLLAGFGGYVMALHHFPSKPQDRDLVRELRIIENLRFYESVESLDFLRELDQRDLFGEDTLDS
jgi:anti-sigma factor RsiW